MKMMLNLHVSLFAPIESLGIPFICLLRMLQALNGISIPELQNRFKTQLWTFWFSPPLSDNFIFLL